MVYNGSPESGRDYDDETPETELLRRNGVAVPEDIAKRIDRHRQFWRREPVDAPLLSITRGDYPWVLHAVRVQAAQDGGLLIHQNINVEQMIASVPDAYAKHDESGRDRFFAPGPPSLNWMEGIIGCPVWVGDESTWSEHPWKDLSPADSLTLDPNNKVFQKLLEYTTALVRQSEGRWPVGQTHQRGPIDMVAALIGDSEFCYAIYDDPQSFQKALERCTDIWLAVAKAQFDLIPRWHGGYVLNHGGLWCPGTVTATQIDASALLSPAIYAKHVLPQDRRIFASVDYSSIHLHSGSMHTAEILAQEKDLKAIECALDLPAGPSVAELIPVFRKVLERKPLIVDGPVTFDEALLLVEKLPFAGLSLGLRFENDPEADEFEAYCRKKGWR